MSEARAAFVVVNSNVEPLRRHCRALGIRAAVVVDPEERAAVIFPALSGRSTLRDLASLTARFSGGLDRAVLATARGVTNVLWLGLCRQGHLVLDYDSAVWELPWNDYAKLVARELEVPSKWATLRFALKSRWVVFDRHRHWLILKALDLPAWIPRYSYSSFSTGATPLHERGVRIEQV
jgi:hypothetical protein